MSTDITLLPTCVWIMTKLNIQLLVLLQGMHDQFGQSSLQVALP